MVRSGRVVLPIADHPVCAFKGSFAIFLMRNHPSYSRRGLCVARSVSSVWLSNSPKSP